MNERVTVRYTVRSGKMTETLRFAVTPDLHNVPFDDALEEILACDAVLVPGDLVNRHKREHAEAARFLDTVSARRPLFYSPGNHEWKYRRAEEWKAYAKNSAAVYLDNDCVRFRGICIGGLSSNPERRADGAFLERFAREDGFRLLMCHHPEMYKKSVSGRGIDLTVCGHAHGGQVQIGGVGLYAPGQGLFPRMIGGTYDGGRMILSRGMTNGSFVPRINAPCELVIVTLCPENGDIKEEEA